MYKEGLIYLDNNSTTKIDPRVLDAIMPYLAEYYANASSRHSFGVQVRKAVENARAQIAELIGCEICEIIFTSGATEAINLAIKGIAKSYKDRGNHIVTVCTEHNAVLHTCNYLENIGYNVTYLPVQRDGLIDLDDLKKALTLNTVLVSVMYANNEIGVIQPIKEIAEITHEAGAFFMTDATQGFGKVPIDVDESGIDLMTFSGHKIHERRLTSFASVIRKLETIEQLEWYAEDVDHRGRLTFQNRLQVAVELPERVRSVLYCSGEVGRVDMVLTGGYAAWLIRVRGADQVFTELCMPLIQDSIARITLNIQPSEVQVGVYSFEEFFVDTRKYTPQEISDAHLELYNLLRRMGY